MGQRRSALAALHFQDGLQAEQAELAPESPPAPSSEHERRELEEGGVITGTGLFGTVAGEELGFSDAPERESVLQTVDAGGLCALYHAALQPNKRASPIG